MMRLSVASPSVKSPDLTPWREAPFLLPWYMYCLLALIL